MNDTIIEFRKEMKHTHKILFPMMLPIHFQFLQNILRKDGYDIELLSNDDANLVNEGLRNVHNDTCYPALLVIGQMISALKSGAYDIDHVALAITQTGGGCRASNYIHLLRKALIQAGFPQVPVISVNFSNIEKHGGFKLTPTSLLRIAVAFLYGDLLMWISNQVQPYELEKGSCKALINTWIEELTHQLSSLNFLKISHNTKEIVHDFAHLPRSREPKIRVGIVGEIYMKYAPLGNNHLEDFLLKENCEPVISGVLDFALYCLENTKIDYNLYERNKKTVKLVTFASNYIQKFQNKMIHIIQEDGNFRSPTAFVDLMKCSEGFINKGAKMGEGWLLTSEMVELIHSGVNDIVCCQPFGCLPNHIVARGMMRKIKTTFPLSNIVAVDFDPGAPIVNQENRLKLMLANAHLNKTFQSDTTILSESTKSTETNKKFVYE